MSQVEFLVKVRDGAEKIMEGAALIRDAAEEYLEKIAPADKWDPNKIKWDHTEGPKGEYERSEEINSPDFKLMLKDLAQHEGKMERDGWFYWTFQNGVTVGRKRKAGSNPHQRMQKSLDSLEKAGKSLTT